ncbi:hypothetical protein V0288_11135 [Pannus brasiliensis CCIBt3594]|uniref:Transposase n=1 Tax=Pannus brasiliensis CCIBt3594 TaxID=1427578 RepID=A0AAW9QVK9_9CHRO
MRLLTLVNNVITEVSICPIRYTMRERRKQDKNKAFGQLTEVYCLGHHDPKAFFQVFLEEYEKEIPDIWRAYNPDMVERAIGENGQPITRIRL